MLQRHVRPFAVFQFPSQRVSYVVPLGFGATVLVTVVASVFAVDGALLCLGATPLDIPREHSS